MNEQSATITFHCFSMSGHDVILIMPTGKISCSEATLYLCHIKFLAHS